MENTITRIGSHVYVKGGIEAVKIYKEAFNIEDDGNLWLDSDGVLVYHELWRDGRFFLSVSDEKHLPTDISKSHTGGIIPTMTFNVYFSDKDALKNANEILYNDINPCERLTVAENGAISCNIIDKFGVFWYLCVPYDWNASFVPK